MQDAHFVILWMQPSSFAKLSTPKNSPVGCIFSPLFAATADDDDEETEQEKNSPLFHFWKVMFGEFPDRV